MNKKVYDIKTGKDYEYIEEYTDEIVARKKKGNKIIIDKTDVIYEDEVNNFKKIFKLLCNRGDIRLINEKYSKWGEEKNGIIPTSDYFKTTLMLDNEELLVAKCKLNK